jgi:hypothetical protein
VCKPAEYAGVVTEWTVVLDDGTRPYGPGIQPDQRRPLSMVVSDDWSIEIDLVNPVGGTVTLSTGDFLVLNARSGCAPSRQLFSKRSVSAPNYRHRISMTGDESRALSPQVGTFDLWLVRGDRRSCLIPTSEIRILGSALGNNHT